MRTNHLDPDEAVAVHKDLGARFSVGMHWGTFADLTDEPLDEVPKRFEQALTREGVAPDKFFLMQHGGTRLLQGERSNALPRRVESQSRRGYAISLPPRFVS